jgi:hypothetical protein
MKVRSRRFMYSRAVVFFTALMIVLSFCQCAPSRESAADEFAPPTMAETYSELNPWGHWYLDSRFGEVWYPDVDALWKPFSDGYWTWTDQGWLWSSYESYGWLVYHYGNWYYDRENGWFWVPGDTWSPAVVTWVAYDDYICWAPTPPVGGYWSDPWEAGSGQVIPWTTVHTSDFTQDEINKFAVHVELPAVTSQTTVDRQPPRATFIADKTRKLLIPKEVTRQQIPAGRKTLYKVVVPGSVKHKETQAPTKAGTRKQVEADKVTQKKKSDLKETAPATVEKKPEPSKVEKKPGLLPAEKLKEADSTKVKAKRPRG